MKGQVTFEIDEFVELLNEKNAMKAEIEALQDELAEQGKLVEQYLKNVATGFDHYFEYNKEKTTYELRSYYVGNIKEKGFNDSHVSFMIEHLNELKRKDEEDDNS